MRINQYIIRGITFLVLLIVAGCSTSSYKLTEQGWRAYRNGNYAKAEKKFSKAINKNSRSDRAYDGLASVNYALSRNNNAEYYISRAYSITPSSADYTYKYALYSSLNGKNTQAMNLLFELPEKGNFNAYRLTIAASRAFQGLRSNPQFQRYLLGYRRLLLQPYYGASTASDKFTQNDLFLMVENQNRVILTTRPVQDRNQVQWNNDYVVWDYPLGSVASLSLLDEDYTSHDNLLTTQTYLKPGDYTARNSNTTLKYRVSDTEMHPYTSGTSIPSTISLSQIATGIGVGALAVATINDLSKTFSSSSSQSSSNSTVNSSSPFVSCSTPTKNSTDLYILSVGTDPNVFSDKDAYALTNELRKGCGDNNLFGNIYSITLASSRATKAQIINSLNEIRKKTNEDDIFLFFFSGHGGVLAGKYIFETYDREAIMVDDIVNSLDADNCKTIFWFDTCHAGKVKDDFRNNIDDYIKRKVCPNVSILMSSSDREASYPDKESGLGYFTKAIIDGLGGEADEYPGNGIISLRELEHYILHTVARRTNSMQHPQILKHGRKAVQTRLSRIR